MPPSPTSTAASPTRRRAGGAAFVRLLRFSGIVTLVILAGLGTAYGWSWWQDRPLREAAVAIDAGNPSRALSLSDYYLEIHPGSGRAEAMRARALVELARAEEAIAIYDRVGAAGPDDLLAWGRAHLLREEWSRAAPLLGQAVRLAPDDPDALYELSTCLTRLGRLEEATKIGETFAGLPGQRARGDVLLGAIRADAGDPDGAVLAFARALAVAPDGQDLQVPPEEFFQQYAAVLMNLGRGEEAIPLLERSIAAGPTAAAHHLLGTALSRKGDTEGAVAEWKKSIELDPAGVTPREDLAAAAIARGDVAAAREQLAPLAGLAERRFQSAYLFQRLAAIERDDAAFARWKEKTDELRRIEDLVKILEKLMADDPMGYWPRVVRSHKFATLGNWPQAADLMATVPVADDEHPFVARLREAVRTRGSLPPLEDVPIRSK